MPDPVASLESVSLAGSSKKSPLRLVPTSLQFLPGTVTALLGPSGAGKTSLLNLLARFEKPTSGTLTLPPCIGWAPADAALWPHLSARNHLGSVSPRARPDLPGSLLEAFALSAKSQARPGELSEGEKDRLAVARAIANCHNTPSDSLLVLDEPLVHVDPARRRQFWQAIRAHTPSESAIVFSTHDPADALSEAGRVLCLDAGAILFDGASATLYNDPPSEILATYLGPANWFGSQGGVTPWIDTPVRRACIRPENLEIRPAASSPLAVESTRFCGSHEAVTLTNPQSEPRTFYHRPTSPTLKPGVPVALRILTLILTLFFLPACSGPDNGPRLPVANSESWHIPAHGPTLPSPRSLTVNAEGELLVLDTAGRVVVLSTEGEPLRDWPMPESDVGKPEGVTVLEDGRIVVCDTHYHRLVYFNPDGTVDKFIGDKGEGAGQFIYPVAITQGDAGNIYVGEYGGNDRIQKFTKEGEYLAEFGGFGVGDGEFQRPSGLVWHAGQIYVADAFNNRIQQFKEDGTFVRILGDVALEFPYDIAWTKGGLMVIEYGAGRLTHLSPEGTLLARYGTTGTASDQFATPWGLAADKAGNLRVADTGNRRIIALTLTP